MAQLAQYKVNQFAKDLNLKSKDIVDILESKNISVKSSQATLDTAQFNVLFEALTSSNQIVGIEDYLDGVTHIPSIKKVPEKTEQPEKKVEKTEAPEEKKEAVSKENTAIKTEDAPKKEATEKKAEPEKKVEKTEAPVKKAEPEKKVEFEKKPPVVNRETPAPKKDGFVRKPQGATQNAAVFPVLRSHFQHLYRQLVLATHKPVLYFIDADNYTLMTVCIIRYLMPIT